MKKILVVDDNVTICLMLKSWLIKNNYDVDTASSVSEAIKKVKDDAYDLILSDIVMPEVDGFSLLSWIQKYDSDIQVMMMTSFADIESAVEAMKMGAVDYISKPIDAEMLFQKLDAAFRERKIEKQSRDLQQYYISSRFSENESIHEKIIDVIRDNSHLLVIGNEGTGKTTAAKFIYIKRTQGRAPFVVFDLNQNGVDNSKMGDDEDILFSNYMDSAKGGVLYIKGFRKIDINFQTSLIRALTKQSKNDDYTQIVIATTYTQEQIKESFIPKLSEILLQSFIELPNLEGKRDEIVSYTEFFLKMANKELNKNISKIEPEVYEVLFEQSWKGNIQELKNLVFKMVILSEKDIISKDIIPYIVSEEALVEINLNSTGEEESLDSFRKENFERKKIAEALQISKGNKTLAASLLNIDRKTLYNKIRLYAIQ